MKLSKKILKTPIIAFVVIAIISAVTYFTITNLGFNFNSALVQTTRAEIQGKPDDINAVVSEIYKKTDIVNTEVGDNNEGVQIQRLSFKNSEETKTIIKEVLANKEGLRLSFAEVNPGIKTDFSNQLTNLLLLTVLGIVAINITLFRRVFDYNQIFLYSLLNIASILIGVAILLTGLSILGKYGWHITGYTLNVSVALVFSAMAGLVAFSLMFKQTLGNEEYVKEMGTHFEKFMNMGFKPKLLAALIVIISFAPLFYFYQFRVEALIGIVGAIFVLIVLKFAYIPVLSWYDEVRRIKNKISKKKK